MKLHYHDRFFSCIAVIPMVPVVNATPSVPPLPLTTPIAAAATSLNSSPPAKNASSPPQQQQQQPASPHLLCASQIKVETIQQPICAEPSQSQSQVQIQYPTSISTNGSGSQHALVPHQAPPTSQPRPNGVTVEDMRGMEGKRRPGGSVHICVCVCVHVCVSVSVSVRACVQTNMSLWRQTHSGLNAELPVDRIIIHLQ